MIRWLYVRAALVVASFTGGVLGEGDQGPELGGSLSWIAVGVFMFGVIGMLFIIGMQAINPRSAPYWRYPSWACNPFTLREPLQFFHLGGYFFLAAGVGRLLRFAFDRSIPLFESVVFAFWGGGIVVGVWLGAAIFRKKMLRA
jgi:hypothetical protein